MNWALVFVLALMLGLLALFVWIVVKPPWGKGSPTALGQFVGEQLLLVNKDKQRAVEDMIYQKEDKKKEN